MNRLRLVLDAAACDGHAICVLCCAERIALDRWGFPEVSDEPLASGRLVARARRAVAACPKGALSLEPAGQDPTSGHRRGREPAGAPASRGAPDARG